MVTKPRDKKAIGFKWIFKTKFNPDGSICKQKGRLVVKGYSQQARIDNGVTFALVARMEIIRLILAISASMKCKVFHLDMKSAFLNGVLQKEVYLKQPEGYMVHGHEEKVYKLQKALYGLKQAPRDWYGKIDCYLLDQGFTRIPNDPTLHVRCGGSVVVMSLYVDDLIVTGQEEGSVETLKNELGD